MHARSFEYESGKPLITIIDKLNGSNTITTAQGTISSSTVVLLRSWTHCTFYEKAIIVIRVN